MSNFDSKNLILKEVSSPIWLSVSEAAKVAGVNNKTIRRALQTEKLKYKIVKNRYFIKFSSIIEYSHKTTKLKNKLNDFGVGQYVRSWKDVN